MDTLSKKEKFLQRSVEIMQDLFEIVSGVVIAISYGVIWLFGKVISGTFSFFWGFIKGVANNVYGRVVVGVGGFIYLYLVFIAHSLVK